MQERHREYFISLRDFVAINTHLSIFIVIFYRGERALTIQNMFVEVHVLKLT